MFKSYTTTNRGITNRGITNRGSAERKTRGNTKVQSSKEMKTISAALFLKLYLFTYLFRLETLELERC